MRPADQGCDAYSRPGGLRDFLVAGDLSRPVSRFTTSAMRCPREELNRDAAVERRDGSHDYAQTVADHAPRRQPDLLTRTQRPVYGEQLGYEFRLNAGSVESAGSFPSDASSMYGEMSCSIR